MECAAVESFVEFQVKSLELLLPPMPLKVNEQIAAVKAALAPFEVDGWKGHFFNHVGPTVKKRKDGCLVVKATFTRQVGVDGKALPKGNQLHDGENPAVKAEDSYLNFDERKPVVKTWGGVALGNPRVIEED